MGDTMNTANAASTRQGTRLTWLAAAAFLAFPGAFMVPAVTSAADAAVEQPRVDQSSWVTATVPHAHLSVELSTAWTKPSKELSDQTNAQKPSSATILFYRVNTQSGDSYVVNRYRGKQYTYWFKNLDEFRANAAAAAKVGDAKLVSATKTKVGTRPGYLQLETFVDAHQPVIWGDLDIREKKNSVISVVIEMNADQPAARATIQAMFDDVKPA
jgi:hypothetical protein